jgi:hypothetical protein
MSRILKLTLRHNSRAALPNLIHSTLHHIVDDLLRRQALVDNSTSLAHQERPSIVHRVIVNIIPQALQVVLDGNVALRRQLLDLLRAVRLPVVNVRVVAHAQRTTGEDDGADVVVEAGGADGFLVRFRRAGFLGQDEASADPDGAGAQRHGGRQGLAVEEAAGGDDLDFGAQAALLAFAHGRHGGDQDCGGDVSRVSAALAALGADHVCAEGEALGDVLRVADHVHVEDAGFVEAVDGGFGGHADGGDEEAGA